MSRVLVICNQRFNGQELWTLLKVLKQRGHTFEVVSTSTRLCQEDTLRKIRISRTVPEVMASLDTFEAFAITSGDPVQTRAYWFDENVQKIVETFDAKGMPIGGICSATPSIRYAAKDRRVSCYPMLRVRELIRTAGGIVNDVSLTIHDNLVTAENFAVATPWADAFSALLENKDPTNPFTESPFKLKLSMRKPIPEVERLKELRARAREGNGESDAVG